MLTIATRGSKLALWQAGYVKARLLAAYSFIERVDLLILKTKGDKILDVPLAKVGGKGLFVKEIEEALLDGRADFAVHSMKDVPMDLPEGLVLGAVLEREDPRDMFLSVRHASLGALPPGARVGTSSLRRQAQLLAARPDLEITSLRGNVDTRLNKLKDGEFEAIIMAAAGINRLGLDAPYMLTLPETTFLPAAGQGALGLEYCASRLDVHELLALFDHEETHLCVAAERGFLASLGGGCQTPIAAHATIGDGMLSLEGLLMDTCGQRAIRRTMREKAPAGAAKARAMGGVLASNVTTSGGDALLEELFAQS